MRVFFESIHSLLNSVKKKSNKLHKYDHFHLKNGRYIATIGNFDGVHIGHQQVLFHLRQMGQALNLPTIAIIFEPQPLEYLKMDSSTIRLTTFVEKIRLLRQIGIDYILCLRFNADLANLSAADFVSKLLISVLQIKGIVVGDDFVFGRDRRGNGKFLQDYGQKYHFSVCIVPPYKMDNIRISSSAIRYTLQNGDVQTAAQMLGRPYSATGRIVHGDKLGTQLGFPTANIAILRKVLPLTGVYAVRVLGLANKIYYGVANIGFRPTINNRKVPAKLLEVYLLNFSADIYQHKITVEFLFKVRDEKKFPNFDMLKRQIKDDVLKAEQYFKKYET